MAGNQLGKTWAGGFEVAMHATGRYPDWWRGHVIDKPNRGWVAGVTGESTRDNPQRILIGPPQIEQERGTGSIPGDCILDVSMGRGVADAIDSVQVRHISGGVSVITFKSYEKGRAKWQGETLDWVWYDEEPPIDIYMEGLTRTNATQGRNLITFTPLLGMSEVVRMFLGDKTEESS